MSKGENEAEDKVKKKVPPPIDWNAEPPIALRPAVVNYIHDLLHYHLDQFIIKSDSEVILAEIMMAIAQLQSTFQTKKEPPSPRKGYYG